MNCPIFILFSLSVSEPLTSKPANMSPRAASVEPRPSPLTNSKLLAVFKGQRAKVLKMEAVSSLGEHYMQKNTSIRYVLGLEEFKNKIHYYIFQGGFLTALKSFVLRGPRSRDQETLENLKSLKTSCLSGLPRRMIQTLVATSLVTIPMLQMVTRKSLLLLGSWDPSQLWIQVLLDVQKMLSDKESNEQC